MLNADAAGDGPKIQGWGKRGEIRAKCGTRAGGCVLARADVPSLMLVGVVVVVVVVVQVVAGGTNKSLALGGLRI